MAVTRRSPKWVGSCPATFRIRRRQRPSAVSPNSNPAPRLGSVGRFRAVPGQPLVAVENVNKWFGDLHVLVDIDLTVDRGEVVVIIGPSGSGKSTLCRCINRLEPIESGTISIDGVPLP